MRSVQVIAMSPSNCPHSWVWHVNLLPGSHPLPTRKELPSCLFSTPPCSESSPKTLKLAKITPVLKKKPSSQPQNPKMDGRKTTVTLSSVSTYLYLLSLFYSACNVRWISMSHGCLIYSSRSWCVHYLTVKKKKKQLCTTTIFRRMWSLPYV